ncbi:hypothetical protein [Streptomyces yaizuensis]|uniref:Integral membrane protein n=1 Tax=Streptomyces yaizuensis TaxID=2989713 RepID=A0ABQ5NVZ7_9ACTN|nr:hypothetical protein [Streptomyces sp. YSPA8]GLF94516.1 hypothetical protein SYYSPA8_09485 [Streptomyces sp. YSPA8]
MGAPGGGHGAARYRAGGPTHRGTGRYGTADPVAVLLRRHRELCARAVDPLEIAAGLEARGVTQRTVAHCRHRDLFSLAEELYARVPRSEETPPPPAGPGDPRPRRGGTPLALLCGATGVLAAAGLVVADGPLQDGCALAGALAVTVALATTAPGHGHPRIRERATLALTTLWLLAWTVYGDDLTAAIPAGGPDAPPAPVLAPLAGLALATAPALWAARLFAVRVGRALDDSRGLAEFATRARRLALLAAGGHALALAAALATVLALTAPATSDGIAGAVPAFLPAAALGLLLFPALLLTAHGRARTAARGLAAACAVEVTATALLFGGRLPGCAALAAPVESAVTAFGTGVVAVLACATTGTALLIHTALALSRASAHSGRAPR